MTFYECTAEISSQCYHPAQFSAHIVKKSELPSQSHVFCIAMNVVLGSDDIARGELLIILRIMRMRMRNRKFKKHDTFPVSQSLHIDP